MTEKTLWPRPQGVVRRAASYLTMVVVPASRAARSVRARRRAAASVAVV
ncbi:hypothetical protein OG592_41860 (plasmid) [Streptomyces avidinii]|nr:hypothetical protein OG592_41860 [Streptomyces avidinii]